MLNCIKFSAATFDCATTTPLKVTFRDWFTRKFFQSTRKISSWKIHKLILSDTGKNSTNFEKKKTENFFYKLKKIEKLEKVKSKRKKIIFVKFTPKRSAQKWTSNKMSNAKKGHNKMGRDKVVAPKRRASGPKMENSIKCLSQEHSDVL